MAKMYTLDKKLLIGSPEIKIGDTVYPIDDRNKTVRKVMKLSEQLKDKKEDSNVEEFEVIDQIFELAFGTKYKEIEKLDLSFRAYLDLVDIVIDAMTQGDPEKYEKVKAEKDGNFPDSSAD